MQALDVMTGEVFTVHPETSVKEIAGILLDRGISAVPVVDDTGRLLGIVSEGDLMRRSDLGTAQPRSWWLALLTSAEKDARQFVRTHGRLARDVMSRDVITVDETASLQQIAAILERHRIKRVPVVRDGRLVGIVSRADLLRALAVSKHEGTLNQDDRHLQTAVYDAIRKRGATFVSAIVTDGVAHLWGSVEEPYQKDEARVAAENVPGIRSVDDAINVLPPSVHTLLWTE